MGEEYEKIGEVSYGFFKSFCNEQIEGIKNFFVKNRVGFLPPGMDYTNMQKIKNKTIFKQLKFLIGKHRTLSIIILGLYLSELDKKIKSTIIDENKHKIYDKYGTEGVSILNIATTGFIVPYIQWLSDFNIRNNPSQSELIDLYEKILKDWEERAVFIQSIMNTKSISEKIIAKINMGKDVFFVFACKSAIDTTKEAITLLTPFNHEYKYFKQTLNNNEDELVWIFEKIKVPLDSSKLQGGSDNKIENSLGEFFVPKSEISPNNT